jgi:hypothetical protein
MPAAAHCTEAWQPTPSRLKPVLPGMRGVSGTGFSREEACLNGIYSEAWRLTPSRLKPVPQKARAVCQWDRLQPGRGLFEHHRFCGMTTNAFPAKASPTEGTRCASGTGFSREKACLNAIDSVARRLTPSRLKPVPQKARAVCPWDRLQPGKGLFERHRFCGMTTNAFPDKAGPTEGTRRIQPH